MKCNNCGTIMELYKSSTHLHFTERRYRCPVCGLEDVNSGKREIPKPIYKEVKKKKE